MLQGIPIPGRVIPTAREVYRAEIGEKVEWIPPPHGAGRKRQPEGVLICPRCHAISTHKRWFLNEPLYDQLREEPSTRLVLCPGCRRIERQEYEGEVHLRGPWLRRLRPQAMHLIANVEQQARQANPISRVASVENCADEILIFTTTNTLAERIGRAFHSAFKGQLRFQRLPGQHYSRICWSRA